MDTHDSIDKKPSLMMRTYIPTNPVVITKTHAYINDVRVLQTSSLHLIVSLLKLRSKGKVKLDSWEMADIVDNLKSTYTVVDVDDVSLKVKLYHINASVYELNDLL